MRWGVGDLSDSELEGLRSFLSFFFVLGFWGEGERGEDEALRNLGLGLGEGLLARFLGGDSTDGDLSRFCLTGDLDGWGRRLLESSSEDGRRRRKSRGGSRPRRGGLRRGE